MVSNDRSRDPSEPGPSGTIRPMINDVGRPPSDSICLCSMIVLRGEFTRGVARLLSASLPGFEVRSVEYLGEGDFTQALLVNGEQVVRIPKHEEAAVSLDREARFLPQIAALLPLAIPQP